MKKINVFTYDVQKGIENYSKQIKMCVEEFKRYFLKIICGIILFLLQFNHYKLIHTPMRNY